MSSRVVDPDVVSFAFKGDTRAALYDRHLAGQVLVISFQTLAELDLWALERRWGQSRKARLERHLRHVVIHPFSRALCREWAKVMHDSRRRGRPIQTADAWHAATALLLDVPLVTHNAADFEGIEGLEVLTEEER
jgi:tRNA(fMet)-specific endonuclease VapC